ncbi:YdcH family protein [Pseudogulbenkiania sp. MAI-1]|uniref:YdcH family protein n=1 Tax=Pseudogulbenkiania sp. MAI-1 TaxID=990370 RepID=UPI00045E9198|nr:YdcH family protein [Pseudogulbenkiania sp. MAI-1]
MHIDHHPLAGEFPGFKDKIHELRQDGARFTRLFGDYEQVDKAVVRIENQLEAASDEELERLKKTRLALKDQLYSLIRGGVS